MRLLRPVHLLWAYAAESIASLPMRCVRVAARRRHRALRGRHRSRSTHNRSSGPCGRCRWRALGSSPSSSTSLVGCAAFYFESSMRLMDAWLVFFFILSGYLLPIDLFPPTPSRRRRLASVPLSDWPSRRAHDRRAQGPRGRRAPPTPVGLGRRRPRRDVGPLATRAASLRVVRRMSRCDICACSAMQIRASLLLAMQHRTDFLLAGFTEVFWMATAVVPLRRLPRALHGRRLDVRRGAHGHGVVDLPAGDPRGGHQPEPGDGRRSHPERDARLRPRKPADAQFLVSTARFNPWQSVNVFTAIAHLRLGLSPPRPAPHRSATSSALPSRWRAAIVVLYSIWILTVSAAFYVVRIDNLSQLFNAVFDAARWPVDVFGRAPAARLHVRRATRGHDDSPGQGPSRQAAGERPCRRGARGQSSPSAFPGRCGRRRSRGTRAPAADG